MTIKNLFNSVFIILLLCFNANAQSWDPKKDLPEGREGTVCFSVGNKIYWGGGTSTSKTEAKADFHEYDPTTNSWTKKANLPEARAYGAAFAINGKGYICIGKTTGSGSSSYLTNLYEYDAANDVWTKKADFIAGFGITDCVVFVVNNKAYLLGGVSQSLNPLGRMYEYDPANDSWTQKADYPATNQGNNWVRMPFAFSIGNTGYVSCGEVRKKVGAGSDFSKETYAYDPATDTWTQKVDFPGDGRLGGNAWVRNGKAFCGLGASKDANFQNIFYKDVYSYDASTDKWTKEADYPGAGRVYGNAAVADGVAYVGGGSQWGLSYENDWYSIGAPSFINSVKVADDVTVYPNPASDKVYIKSQVQFDHYSITTLTGSSLSGGKMKKGNVINTNMLAAGIYILQMTTKDHKAQSLLTIR